MTREKEADILDKSRKVLRRVLCRSKSGDSGEPFGSLAKEGKAEKGRS